MSGAAGILGDITLVEASSFVASPSAGLYLAQLGATVIRVDQAGGGPDHGRWPLGPDGRSLYWENLNRGKRSVALELGSDAGRRTLIDLAAATGILLTNYPADGFLSHAALAALRADMITVRIMGRGDGGPALDYTVNAAVGVPFMTGDAAHGDAPVNHVLPAWDLLCGAYAAFALLAALRHRERTGEGREVRIALQDVATASVANLGMLAEAAIGAANRPRHGNAVYGAFGRDFVTRDEVRVMLMAITPKQWRALVDVLGIGAVVADVEHNAGVSFARDEGLRFIHREALFALVESAVAQRDWAELEAALDAAGGCYGAYQTMLGAAQDPALVTANPLFTPVIDSTGVKYHVASGMAQFAASAPHAAAAAPALGADTNAILAALRGGPMGN